MVVGSTHLWDYKNGKWWERKVAPDEWAIQFNCIKTRARVAPPQSGAKVNTRFHWFIIADQIATKLDANSYQTTLRGTKFKIGHQRPYWKEFSYMYPEQEDYQSRVIRILENVLARLKSGHWHFPSANQGVAP